MKKTGHGETGNGRNLIVTGASSGIGAATALAAIGAGYRTVLVGRDGRRLARVAGRATAAGQCLAVEVDLTADEAPAKVVESAIEWFGDRIDGIVHCAGIFRMTAVTEDGLGALDSLYRINLRAPFALTTAALDYLGAGSSIVVLGSNLTRVAKPEMALYTATKAALEGLARSLSVELGMRGIRINTVTPGIVRTPMVAAITEDEDLSARETAATALGRLGDPEDVAGAIVFLLSDEARHITGSTLAIDGGESVR